MARWQPSGAQQAVDIVAAVMSGQPPADVRVELDHWLGRRDAVLPEPLLSRTVAAIAGGRRVVVLPAGPVPGSVADGGGPGVDVDDVVRADDVLGGLAGSAARTLVAAPHG